MLNIDLSIQQANNSVLYYSLLKRINIGWDSSELWFS